MPYGFWEVSNIQTIPILNSELLYYLNSISFRILRRSLTVQSDCIWIPFGDQPRYWNPLNGTYTHIRHGSSPNILKIHPFLLLLEHFSSNLATNFTKCTPSIPLNSFKFAKFPPKIQNFLNFVNFLPDIWPSGFWRCFWIWENMCFVPWSIKLNKTLHN